ncbi:hypothetical protein TIFTF001_016570 [Ficus carica]|uniref:Uncharacterized protein n=1 Tax=Ficus carica TaxID=3494 RepID=A0AA88A7S6_FICCA|nr:hypothetical protein TIFTF001_016570 [Ficus carica]
MWTLLRRVALRLPSSSGLNLAIYKINILDGTYWILDGKFTINNRVEQNQHFGRKIPKYVPYPSNLPACRAWVRAEGRVRAVWAAWAWKAEWGRGQCGGGVGGVGGEREREKWRKGGVEGGSGEREIGQREF